jgi:nuclear pore complex protein Nup188
MLTIFLPMQSVSTMISLAMLPIGILGWVGDRQNEDEVSPNAAADKPFILNTQTVAEIHTILLNAADASLTTAGPAILAWSIVLRTLNFRVLNSKTPQLEAESSRFDRRSSTDTDITLVPDRYDDVMEQIKASLDEDVIDFLARSAVNICRVFETLTALSSRFGTTSNAFFSIATGARMRMVILNLIKNSTAVGYIPEIVEATVSTLTGGQNYWDILDSKPLLKQDNPIRMFLRDEDLLNALLKSAQWRYPFESLPFLRMIRAVASYSSHQGREMSPTAISFLDALPMFTYQLPPDFVDYETMQEEDNNNNIRLLRPIQLFEQRSRGMGNQGRSMALMVIDPDFYIPAGTAGRIISESGPRVAFWFHEYSGLKYFGKLLETFLTASDLVDATTGQPADRDSVSEIIELLATLLLSIAQSAETNINWQADALEVLEKASSGLSQSRDIISVVFDIFEQELQNLSSFSGSDVPLEVLVGCVHFIHALLPTSPGRVWPLLSKSGLLGVGSGSGQLSTIVEGVELISGRYNLLISCCRLYDSLVEDFATNAITRRSKGRSSGGRRYTQGAGLGTSLPDQFLSKVLFSFTRYMMDVFESSFAWKFIAQDDRHWISRSIGKTFDAILQYSYGLESAADATKEADPKTKEVLKPETGKMKRKEKLTKIMEALMPSASLIVEGFLSASSGTLRFQPLLRSYFDGLDTPDLSTFLNRLNLWTTNVSNTLSFSKTLLRVSKVLERPTSQLESQLFKASPLIARLYAVHDTYRNHVVGLFEAMVVTASSKTSEPPSLLGHLGPNTARNFLYLLSDLDNPLSRGRNVYAIWHFLSMVVSSRQQWFANYLLTGRTPRDASRSKISGRDLATLDKPLLATALETLSKIDQIPRSEALAILEFVALAQNFWPWTVCDSPKYSGFISNISEFVGNLRPIQPSPNLEATIDACYQSRIAGYIAEVLAMHLFHTRQKGYHSTAKDLVPNLSYFTRFAVAVPSYNTSLHTMLKRNFEDKYPGCSLGDLKRNTLEDHQFGREYFYDLSLADKMLCLHQAWTGRKDDGLRNEFARANVNLSLVDAQIVSFLLMMAFPNKTDLM